MEGAKKTKKVFLCVFAPLRDKLDFFTPSDTDRREALLEKMLQDPAHVVATQAWFIKANEDLREAEFVLTASPPFIGSSLFHSGQAVEKALKGFLTWHQVAFTTDDLEQLRMLCAGVDGSLGDVLLPVDQLTEYAWRFRYPNDLAEPEFDQATDTLRLAAAVVGAVLAKVVADAQR